MILKETISVYSENHGKSMNGHPGKVQRLALRQVALTLIINSVI